MPNSQNVSIFSEKVEVGVIFSIDIIDMLFQDNNIYCKNLVKKYSSEKIKKIWYKTTTKTFYIFGGNSPNIRFRVFLEIARKILKIRYILRHDIYPKHLLYINKRIFDLDNKLGKIWQEKVGACDPDFAKKYMEKFQWVDGTPLGKTMKGRLTPISDEVKIKTNRYGLGYDLVSEEQQTTCPENTLDFPAIYLPETETQLEKDYASTTFVKGKTLILK